MTEQLCKMIQDNKLPNMERPTRRMVRNIVKKLHERVMQGEVKLGENMMFVQRMGLYGYDMPGEAPAKPGVA